MAEDVPADEMRVLLATDLHLGYCERDPVRENDSFETLEEILTIAKEKHVDAVFIAGDMFHENKPSRKTMYRVSEILRRYVFGDERCSLRMASNNADHFRRSDANITFPNFDDDGLEVTLPIFAIHGNHDDPAGDGALSALDVLAATGLINYIGRVNDPTDIKIEPVVLVKGERRQMTVLSLYGLGNMRDERVHKAFTMNQLRFERTQSKGDVEPYNLLMIHQNRVAHAAAAFVPDNMLPDMFHLVLWGHEHDSHPNVDISRLNRHVLQLGSTVAISLTEGESLPKHVALLKLRGVTDTIEPIRLTTVRPFTFVDHVVSNDPLAPLPEHCNEDKLMTYYQGVIEDILSKMPDVIRERNGKTTRVLPLVRLRSDATGYPVISTSRFGRLFIGRVANPGEILQIVKKKQSHKRNKLVTAPAPMGPAQHQLGLRDLITECLNELSNRQKQRLLVLGQTGMERALMEYIDKDEKTSIADFVNAMVTTDVDNLLRNNVDANNDAIVHALAARRDQEKADDPIMMARAHGHAGAVIKDEDEDVPAPTPARTPAPAPAPAPAPVRARAKKREVPVEEPVVKKVEKIDDDDAYALPSAPTPTIRPNKRPAPAPAPVQAPSQARPPTQRPTPGMIIDLDDDDDDGILAKMHTNRLKSGFK